MTCFHFKAIFPDGIKGDERNSDEGAHKQ